MMCPKYVTLDWTHWSLSFKALNPAWASTLQTMMEAFSQSSFVSPETRISSAYWSTQTVEGKSVILANVLCTAAEKTAGESMKPWARRVYISCLPWNVKAKMGWVSGCTGTEKNAAQRSITVKYLCVHGIELTTVGTSGTIGANGVINWFIALKSWVKHHVFFISLDHWIHRRVVRRMYWYEDTLLDEIVN